MGQNLTSSRTAGSSFGLLEAAHKERPRLLAFVRNHVNNYEDAEDILQDVFFRLVNASNVVEPIEQLTAWLFKVTRNRIIDWYRSRKHLSLSAMDSDAGAGPGMDDLLADSSQDPASDVMKSMLWDELNDALEELPELQRQVFVAHELEGKSFKEIEAETGDPLNTLLSRKRYAVLFLRERMKELYDELLAD